MPRRPRVQLPGVPLHVIQRGNNRQACFHAEEDFRFYLEWLAVRRPRFFWTRIWGKTVSRERGLKC